MMFSDRQCITKFLFITGLRSKAIHTQLETPLNAPVYPLTQVKEWVECIDTLDPSEPFTQNHFLNFVLSDLRKYAQNLRRREHAIELSVHIDNSRCLNGEKVIDAMRINHIICLDHLPYSPDLTPCHFWIFGVLQNRMKETNLRNADEVEDFVSNSWSDLR
jgi:hypothetical protein